MPATTTGQVKRQATSRWVWGSGLLVWALAWTRPAEAHVKWFADWSIICPPRDPLVIFTSKTWQTCFVIAAFAMILFTVLDRYLADSRGPIQRAVSRLHDLAKPHAWTALRVGCCAYFLLAAWGLGKPVYLTPELAAGDHVRWIQSACAFLVLSRRASWIPGVALIGLFCAALVDYGWFHLLDYPIFAFVGLTLIVLSYRKGADVDKTFLLLRWGVGLTLLWGGVEKFAYPEWSYPLLHQDSHLDLGLDSTTAMVVYGFGELAMSFGLLFYRIGSQVASGMLLAVFLIAIPIFGWVDMVGHSGVIVVLGILTVTQTPVPLAIKSKLWDIGARSVMFPAVTVALCAAYFTLHAIWISPSSAPLVHEAKMALSVLRGVLGHSATLKESGQAH